MTFKVISESFQDGDYLSDRFALSTDFGFGCNGENVSAHDTSTSRSMREG